MGKSAQSLYQQIALLPLAEQLVLAEHILSELDPSAAEVNKAWLAEAERRLADWRADQQETFSLHDVLAQYDK